MLVCANREEARGLSKDINRGDSQLKKPPYHTPYHTHYNLCLGQPLPPFTTTAPFSIYRMERTIRNEKIHFHTHIIKATIQSTFNFLSYAIRPHLVLNMREKRHRVLDNLLKVTELRRG